MPIRRKVVDNSVERDIAISAVTSDLFLADFSKIFNRDLIISKSIIFILEWCVRYYHDYKKAPGRTIENIYEFEKTNLDESDREIIQSVLLQLSDQYAVSDNINHNYIYDKAVEYFNTQSLKKLAGNIKNALAAGDQNAAQNFLVKHRKIEKTLSGWYDPYSEDNIIRTYKKLDENYLFKLPGAVGELLGGHTSGTLIGFVAPQKRGKSFFMKEFEIAGIMNGYKVASFNLEMDRTQEDFRSLRRVTGTVEKRGEYWQTVFDCRKNQYDDCDQSFRLRSNGGVQHGPEITPKNGYKPCTYCRNHPEYKHLYQTAVYPVRKTRCKVDNVKNTMNKVGKFRKWNKGSLRKKVYPRYTASMDDIERDLDQLEQTENFVPQIIIIDYLLIMQGRNGLKEIDKIDDNWKRASRLVSERHALGVTGHQGNRGSLETGKTKSTNIAGDIRIAGHCEQLIAISMNSEEHRCGVRNLSIMFQRNGKYDENAKVVCLEGLDSGQIITDSEWYIPPPGDTTGKLNLWPSNFQNML